MFCDNNEHKNIINIYFKIIKELRHEVFSFFDEFQDHSFVFADAFTRFRIIKNDNVIDYDDDDDDDDDDNDDHNDINLNRFKFKTDNNLSSNKKINTPVYVTS